MLCLRHDVIITIIFRSERLKEIKRGKARESPTCFLTREVVGGTSL